MRIVSTQKANRAARFSAARFIARHIEVETPRLRSSVINVVRRAKFEFSKISELAGTVVNCTCKLGVAKVIKLERETVTLHVDMSDETGGISLH